MELFDFAELIGCHVTISGAWDKTNTFVNANLKSNQSGVDMGGWSVFGRSKDALLEDALVDLAKKLVDRRVIEFTNKQVCNVPADLKHTPNYRPKKAA